MTRKAQVSLFLTIILVLVLSTIGNLNVSSEVIAASRVEFPTKPISLIVPMSPGGGTDVVGRMIANEMSQFLPHKVLVFNKPGGAGIAGIQEVAIAKPDGYTLLFLTATPIVQTYATKNRINYKDFFLLGLVDKDSFTLVVPKNAKWATSDEFFQAAKDNPGKIRLGHPGVGTSVHLVVPMLEKYTGTKYQQVPFAGSNPTHMALLGGHIDAGITTVGDVSALVKSGDIRMLALSGDNRWKEYPEVPTFKEKGIDIGIFHWRGIWALKETPEPILDLLEEAIKKAANSNNYKDAMIKAGKIPDNIVGRAILQERLKKEDGVIKEALMRLNMLQE
jgi:tripartite-type tricarboxylate transporter receptor subunit TctC